MHRADGVDEVLRSGALEQEPSCPGHQRVIDVVVVLERGHHDDRRAAAVELAEQASGRDPVDPRHPHVHQHDVGTGTAGLRDGRRAVVRLADHDDVRLGLEDRAQAAPDERLVVDQQHLDGVGHRDVQVGSDDRERPAARLGAGGAAAAEGRSARSSMPRSPRPSRSETGPLRQVGQPDLAGCRHRSDSRRRRRAVGRVLHSVGQPFLHDPVRLPADQRAAAWTGHPTPSDRPPGRPTARQRRAYRGSRGPGDGASAGRRRPSSRRRPSRWSRSAAARREVVSMAWSASSAKSGSRSMTLRAADAWTVTSDRACPMLSCISRASRLRSVARAASASRRSQPLGVRRSEQGRRQPGQQPTEKQRDQHRRQRRRDHPRPARQRDHPEGGSGDEEPGQQVQQEPALGPEPLRPAARRAGQDHRGTGRPATSGPRLLRPGARRARRRRPGGPDEHHPDQGKDPAGRTGLGRQAEQGEGHDADGQRQCRADQHEDHAEVRRSIPARVPIPSAARFSRRPHCHQRRVIERAATSPVADGHHGQQRPPQEQRRVRHDGDQALPVIAGSGARQRWPELRRCACPAKRDRHPGPEHRQHGRTESGGHHGEQRRAPAARAGGRPNAGRPLPTATPARPR